jgi:sensor c-di-GMP phosphodiesterase-like protein
MERLVMDSVYQFDPSTAEWESQTTTTSTNRTTTINKSSYTTAMASAQAALWTREADFVRQVVATVGPTHAASIYATVLGSAGTILVATLQQNGQRPLSRLLGSNNNGADAMDTEEDAAAVVDRGRVFVLRFPSVNCT